MNLKEIFDLPTQEKWLQIIQKELKEISYQSLFKKNNDDIPFAPIYHQHLDYEQPIKTQFPEYVSYPHFPYSKTVFALASDFKPNDFDTVFRSLSYSSVAKFTQKQDFYLLISDFYHPENFLSILEELPTFITKFKGIVIDLSYLQECGANNIDSLSLGLYFLEKIPRHNEVILKIAVANDFYAEIAKLRAMNFILQNFGFSHIKIWAKTAEINKSLLHLENNLIRLTTETVAAVLGGCHFISILPFDLNPNEEFSVRISKNILNLLKYEAHFDKVIDPLRGSFAIEKLTNSYTSFIFQQLLFWKSVQPENLWKTILTKTHENLRQIVSKYQNKEHLLIGVNIYPYAQETRSEIKLNFPETLTPVRIAQLL